MKIRFVPRNFLKYKFFNSLFFGLSVGSLFTIYAPLDPSIFSIGGVILALGLLVVAALYEKILTLEWFFKITLFVELIVLAMICFFLLHPYGVTTALLIYSGYQITFMFGSYLVRAETLIVRKKKLLGWLDIFKQSGYLAGLVLSFLFYQLLEWRWGITTNEAKVYQLHWLLLIDEIIVIWYIFKAFKRVKIK
ncbi:MAG: hypothetical protein B6D59_03025 [Campylobacteraceae bacterium 4484_4]|nr:MAG: hypothetical protein B6D59_03025 [Campylobacteraceae bacterium 4484_4]